MNTLTPNRILQKGDQYRTSKGEWKEIDKRCYDMQIEFSPYAARLVRRPTEEQMPITVALTHPPPPQQVSVEAESFADRNETEDADEPKIIAAGLPTVVSHKAHEKKAHDIVEEWVEEQVEKKFPTKVVTDPTAKTIIGAIKAISPPINPEAESEPNSPAATHSAAGARLTQARTADIKFPVYTGHEPDCIWTGRNGTFTGKGIRLQLLPEDNKISIFPKGKRGVGNGLIQFPVEIIPQVIDWLNQQKKETH